MEGHWKEAKLQMEAIPGRGVTTFRHLFYAHVMPIIGLLHSINMDILTRMGTSLGSQLVSQCLLQSLAFNVTSLVPFSSLKSVRSETQDLFLKHFYPPWLRFWLL